MSKLNMYLYKGEKINKNALIDNTDNHELNKDKKDGKTVMEDKKYVTHDELKISQLEAQNKLDRLANKMDSNFKSINQRFDNLERNIPMMIENALYKEREYQRGQQKENRRFFWGTIIIGGVSALAGMASAVISILN